MPGSLPPPPLVRRCMLWLRSPMCLCSSPCCFVGCPASGKVVTASCCVGWFSCRPSSRGTKPWQNSPVGPLPKSRSGAFAACSRRAIGMCICWWNGGSKKRSTPYGERIALDQVMDDVKEIRHTQALQPLFGELNAGLCPVTHQVQDAGAQCLQPLVHP